MDKKMQEIAAWAVKAAKSAGADDCRVGIHTDRFIDIRYRERKPENIKEASSRVLVIDVFANNRYSSQSTSDLRKEALKDFIASAVASTKLLAEDPYRSLPDPKYYEGRQNIDLEIVDSAYEKFTPEARHTMVKTVEDACLSAGGEKTISVTATLHDCVEGAYILTSNGFEGQRKNTYYQVGGSITLQDEGDRRPNAYHTIITISKKDLPTPEEIGRTTALRGLDLLGAKKIKTETLPIIIENRNVPRIFYGFLSAMFGSNIQQKRSFLADKKDQKVGSEHLTVIDDPFVKAGLGSRLFDRDGFAAKKRTMIDKGVLKDFYVDWYYSRKLEWEPTTGGASNLIIPPGKRSVKEIMKDLGRGILITGFIGGNSNSTTGDTSIGIIGQLFEDGKSIQAVAEMNIADNHLKFWQKLAEAANDPWTYSSFRTPSLVFTDVVVSGV